VALILVFQALEKQRWACYPLALVRLLRRLPLQANRRHVHARALLSLLLRQPNPRSATGLPLPHHPAAIIALIFAISVIAPNVHYHMIIAVSRWPHPLRDSGDQPLDSLASSPWLPVALCMMILIRTRLFH
jgi:hypothetical protein